MDLAIHNEEEPEDTPSVSGSGSLQVQGGGTVIIGGGGFVGGSDGTAPSQVAVASSADAPQVAVAQSADASWIQHQQELSPEMEEAASNYVAELNRLTEMLGKVSEQSMRLTRDSEEMENLNRTLTGICKIYEMQLKSASSQIGTIDRINEQSQRMAEQIGELNRIYARMIEAMTANMVKS